MRGRPFFSSGILFVPLPSPATTILHARKNHVQVFQIWSPLSHDPVCGFAHPIHRCPSQQWQSLNRFFRCTCSGSGSSQRNPQDKWRQVIRPVPLGEFPPRGLEQMVKYSRDKAVAGLLRRLVHDGWRFHMRGRHGKLVSPEGRRLPVPCTPSDYRAVDNFKRDLRKLMPFYTRLT